MAEKLSNDGVWRGVLRTVSGLLLVAVALAGVVSVASQSATTARCTYAHLATPAVEALAGKPVKIEDLAQIEQILEYRNSEFREMLMRRGVTKDQIDNFRYGRYKLVREE